jgi:hypothetical protein
VTSFCTLGPGGMDGQVGESCAVESLTGDPVPYSCRYKCLGGYKEFPGDFGSERRTKCVSECTCNLSTAMILVEDIHPL